MPKRHHSLGFKHPLEDGGNYTPPKITIEPENDGLVQMIFLIQGARILRFHVNLPGGGGVYIIIYLQYIYIHILFLPIKNG